jgi:phage terminase Nu1 subunit (DNA packaging protein)
MMSEETRERYRRMTPAERLRITLQMIREAIPELLRGPPEVVDRRFELLRRQNDERNRRILEALARAKEGDHDGPQ